MIYFAQMLEGDELIYIGRAVNPSKAIKYMQRERDRKIELLLVINQRRIIALEKRLHEKFKHLRVEDKWFRPGDELVTFIERKKVRAREAKVVKEQVKVTSESQQKSREAYDRYMEMLKNMY